MKLNRIQVCLLLACIAGSLAWQGHAAAFDPVVSSSLKRSKDALLAQRAELMDACNKRKSQIDQLQQEIDRLDGYVRDTDRTLRDIDIALSRSN